MINMFTTLERNFSVYEHPYRIQLLCRVFGALGKAHIILAKEQLAKTNCRQRALC